MAHAQIAACPRLTGKRGRAATIHHVIATHVGLAPVTDHVSRIIGGRKGRGMITMKSLEKLLKEEPIDEIE